MEGGRTNSRSCVLTPSNHHSNHVSAFFPAREMNSHPSCISHSILGSLDSEGSREAKVGGHCNHCKVQGGGREGPGTEATVRSDSAEWKRLQSFSVE